MFTCMPYKKVATERLNGTYKKVATELIVHDSREDVHEHVRANRNEDYVEEAGCSITCVILKYD